MALRISICRRFVGLPRHFLSEDGTASVCDVHQNMKRPSAHFPPTQECADGLRKFWQILSQTKTVRKRKLFAEIVSVEQGTATGVTRGGCETQRWPSAQSVARSRELSTLPASNPPLRGRRSHPGYLPGQRQPSAALAARISSWHNSRSSAADAPSSTAVATSSAAQRTW